MGPLPFLRPAACLVLVAGCASIAGMNDPSAEVDQEVKEPPPSSSSNPPPSTSTPPTCTPRVEGPYSDGLFHAGPWEGPQPVLDGAFKDWACVPRHELGPGVWTTTKFPKSSNAQIAFRWTRDALFFYALVETTSPGGGSAEGFANDSLNVYIGPPNPAAKFRPEDHQLAFDHTGKVSHYISGQRAPLPATIQQTMTPTTRDGKLYFEVEARLEPKLFGLSELVKGQKLTLGLQLHDRLEDGSVEWRTWFRGAACGCLTTAPDCCNASTGMKNLIACDLRCTGELVLD